MVNKSLTQARLPDVGAFIGYGAGGLLAGSGTNKLVAAGTLVGGSPLIVVTVFKRYGATALDHPFDHRPLSSSLRR